MLTAKLGSAPVSNLGTNSGERSQIEVSEVLGPLQGRQLTAGAGPLAWLSSGSCPWFERQAAAGLTQAAVL